MEKSDLIKVRGRNFLCQLCDIKITSEKAVEDHLKGKKHLRLVSLQESRQQQTQRSIFVGGLSRINGEVQLGDYFSKFGDVARIIIDKDKAHFAIVEFKNDESAKSATSVERQVMNGQKIVVRPRQPKANPTPGGSVGSAKSRRCAQKDGHGKGKSSEEQSKQNKELYQALAKEESISAQMSTLVRLTELTEGDVKLRHLVCDLLQSALEELLPGCRVTPFGSSINGFGVQGCDLDIHLELGESLKSVSKTSQDIKETVEESAGPVDDITSPDLTSASPLDILSSVSDVIKRCVPSCYSIHFIPSARLPVVKFTHKESGLQCDVSMNNSLALKNTKLLKFYSSLLPQVRPLVFTVRRWAKVCQLAGNTGAGPRLTNYALTLMVLFYLQARERPLLPSVTKLEQSGDGQDSVFSQDTSFSLSESTETQAEILSGFFNFYDGFEFKRSVICPLYGKTASVSEVTNQNDDGASQRSFKIGSVNIRDPFELWHNVSLNVNEKTLERISTEFTRSATLCRLAYAQGKSLNDENWGLLLLFGASASKTSSLTKCPSEISTESATDNFRFEISPKVTHLPSMFLSDLRTDKVVMWRGAVKQLAFHLLKRVLKFECRWLLSEEAVETPKKPIESSGKEHTVGSDSPLEGTVQASVSECEDAQPRKRCKVDLAEEAFQEATSLQETSEDKKMWDSEKEWLECVVYYPVWLGRRKARRQVKSQDSNQTKTETEQSNTEIAASKDGRSNPRLTSENLMDTAPTDDGTDLKKQVMPIPNKDSHSLATSGEALLTKDRSCDHPPRYQFTGNDLNLETQVTDLIVAEKLQRSPSSITPILRFSLSVVDSNAKGGSGLILLFRSQGGNDANLKEFLHFFEIFFKNMLDQSVITAKSE
ncbi:speckle targeted PIP5K1A-regulated poly(A) polymerase-like [Asterias rubens]|uniref:speckle targeted PIP5K1A-regulated poly(A) polymerase-like n=1 Tax=Asterias rubens TaxID=7604 RepID=UPI001455D626|nr:speckle targeted PIP5K1A-regulated poly(A) polymerase-like [Asterias rubens]XP_033646927.1 speckle targeted PIP5K1A-regulated poly(A) polymerase-like [Asterias rubens]